jgi:molybdenum cofactor cytidylyltransferase
MVNQNVYNKLIKSRNNYNKKNKILYKKEIVIPTFDGVAGNPVLFSKFMKEKIMNIKGDIGAKTVIKLSTNKILNVPFKNNKIALDFDTEENFKNFI